MGKAAGFVLKGFNGGRFFRSVRQVLGLGGNTGRTAAESGATAARGGVYTLRDEAGAVVRTGRTNDLAARQVQHANDPVLGDFQFNVEYRTDVYAEQRGLEDVLYNRYPEAQAANGGVQQD